MLFNISVSFTQEPSLGTRTARVAEAFGVGLEQKTFTVFKNTEIDIRLGDVIYITGDSGGGKSVLLQELYNRLTSFSDIFGMVASDKEFSVNDDILVDSLGRTVDEAISYLSFAGLNDAYLFLRRYSDLSDGQKYRYKIAKLLSLNRDVIIFDEFCSMLDRETAKAVAFCIQKLIRKSKKTLIVATAHHDLIQDLSPSVLIRKNYGYETDVTYPKTINIQCSLIDKVTIEYGTIEDWRGLEYFHYRAGIPYGPQKIFVAKIGDRIVGAIIYSNSPLSCKPRNLYLGYVPTAEEINKDFVIISRVVVLPKFRGIGLAVKLVKETLPLIKKKYVETIAVMARYNPFFAKAGMTEVKYEQNKDESLILQKLGNFGFSQELYANVEHNLQIIANLKQEELSQLIEIVSHSRNAVGNLVKHTAVSKEDAIVLLQDRTTLAEAISWTAKIAQEKCYYIWENQELMQQVIETE